MGESTDRVPGGAYAGGAADRQAPLEGQLAMLRHTYCRDLVNEGRLDWDGFELEPDAGDGGSERERVVPGRLPAPARRGDSGRRRWGLSRRG